MDLKDLKVEKIALLLLVSFIVILFLDYSFNIVEIINYKWKINVGNVHKLRCLVLISIVPLIQFISKTEYDKKPDILVNSVVPFLTFISGFYIIKWFKIESTEGIILTISVQLILALTVFIGLTIFFSKLLKCYTDWLKKLTHKKVDASLTTTEREKVISVLTANSQVNNSLINYLNRD